MRNFVLKKLPVTKKWLENEKFENIVAWILSFFMRFSYSTTRWTIIGDEIPCEYHKNETPFLVSLWHDRLMLAPCVWHWKQHPLHVLASNHKDGRLIAKVVKHFNMPAVYGSTGKGVKAARDLIKLIKNGKYVAIIPDGPRGPRHKLAPGTVVISRLTKTDILPFSFCVKRYYQFNSWDKFILSWPFNRGVMVWGKPIKWSDLKDMTEEEACSYVESKINECSQKAHQVLIG
ncbi:MAG: lysophospholipid acyltransferase family protein [Alphaproteobacteria bacterium]|nr:lysophospholipid acyltransferase family protein [Alphaproteobacteria bacterium]